MLNLYNIKKINHPYEAKKWTPNKVNPQKYKAIIPLPYFHEGSENIGAAPMNDKIIEKSFLLSMQTGIPLTAVKMSRTSFSQTLQQLEMGHEFTKIPATMLLGAKKPFILLQDIKDTTTLPELINMVPIAKTDSFRLFSFSPRMLEVLLLQRATSIERQAQNQLNSLYFFKDYEETPTTKAFTGKGALAKKATETITLADTACLYCNDSLSVSFWLYGNIENIAAFKLLINNGKNVQRVHLLNHVKAVNNQWVLIEYFYTPKNKKLLVNLIKEGAKETEIIYIDNLLIRAAQYDVLQRTKNFAAKNNRYYSLGNP